MAQRLKTIEYAFAENESTLAAATRFDFTAITLNIPENTSRTFRSVIVEVHMLDGSTAATSLTSWLIGIKLGAVAFNDVTVTDSITNSGENQTWLFTRDVTSYFNTNFGSGTSQTCQVGVNFGGVATRNITAKLIITYEFDDASQDTRVKTVRIPLESSVSALTTTLTEIGTNQVPALDTFLPEASKVYRRIWFEVFGNQGITTATNDASLNLALDAEAADADNVHETGLASDVWFKRIWVRDDMTTNATHAFKMAVSATNGFTCNHMAIVLYVTYEYSHTSSTTIMNSIMIPVNNNIQRMGRTVEGDQSRFEESFYIEEPSTITLAQSGVLIGFSQPASLSLLNVGIGSQANRAYTTSGTMVCGGYSLIQRCDSGAELGAGISLARGRNTVTVDVYNTDATDLSDVLQVVLYLNYTSGKATNGADTHNKTIFWSIADHAADANQRSISAFAPIIPEANYWLNCIAVCSQQMVQAFSSVCTFSVVCERQTGELQQAGWEEVLQQFELASDAEIGCYQITANISRFFDRYPNEQQDRMNLETTRDWRTYHQATGGAWINLLMCFTYHSITFTKSGTVSGSGGGTVNIGLWRKVNGIAERLDTTSRSGNGSFSFTWYDDTETNFVEAFEDATHVGRSADGTS